MTLRSVSGAGIPGYPQRIFHLHTSIISQFLAALRKGDAWCLRDGLLLGQVFIAVPAQAVENPSFFRNDKSMSTPSMSSAMRWNHHPIPAKCSSYFPSTFKFVKCWATLGRYRYPDLFYHAVIKMLWVDLIRLLSWSRDSWNLVQTIQRGGSTTVQSGEPSGMYNACKSQDKLLINGLACYQPSSVVPFSK